MSVRDLRGFHRGQGTYDPNVRGVCNYEVPFYVWAAVAASAAIGAGASVKSAEKQSDALALQRKQGVLEEQRQKRELIRKARIQQAVVAQSAESQGVASSSAAAGGRGSIQSQLGSNLSFLDQYGKLSDQITKASGEASSIAAWGEAAGAVGGLVGTAYGQGWFAPKQTAGAG